MSKARVLGWRQLAFWLVLGLSSNSPGQILAPVSELNSDVSENPSLIQEPPVASAALVLSDARAEVDVSEQPDAFSELQLLRAEVQELRGLVDTLNFRLQQVKQQQLDDYLDLDRRIAITPQQLKSAARSQLMRPEHGSQQHTGPAPRTSALDMATSDSEAIKADYDRASTLLLKQRDMGGAVVAFKAHISEYPQSPYVANASYWLGEIYLLQGLDEEARQEFSRIVDEYAGHNKEMDARFKLGKIYHQLGELARARELLEVAAMSSGAVSSKAKSYLENNF